MAPKRKQQSLDTFLTPTSSNSVNKKRKAPAASETMSKTQKLFADLDEVIAGEHATEKSKDASPATTNSSSFDVDELFITIGRPVFDFHREHDEEDLEEMEAERPEELKKLEDDFSKESKKYFKKKPSESPGWKWVLSKKAYELFGKWDMESQKRDQDRFGMHIYNDFTGYGMLEVIHNILLSFATEFLKTDGSPLDLWAHVEAVTWMFCSGDTDWQMLNMIDDCEGLSDTLFILGLAILSTLNRLEQADLLKADSPIPNLSMVLTTIFEWVGNFEDAISIGKEQVWPSQIVAYAEKHGIELNTVYNAEEMLENHSVDDLTSANLKLVKSAAKADKFGFKAKWSAFSKRRGIKKPGTRYDITKFTKAERKKHAFDGKDPLDEMGMPPED